MQLAERWRLEVDAAYLPFVGLAATDNHWFRANINPLSQQGHGWGSQFEAILSYALTDQWSIGAGGRYWYYATTSAHSQFPPDPTNSPVKYYSERYGGFLQATYKFDGAARAPQARLRRRSTGPGSMSAAISAPGSAARTGRIRSDRPRSAIRTGSAVRSRAAKSAPIIRPAWW